MQALTAHLAARRRFGDNLLTARSQVELAHEKANRHDRAAVIVSADGNPVGYLEAGLAALIAPLLDRGRPLRAAGREDGRSIDLFIPGPRETLGRNLVEVPSSDGSRTYLVDKRRGLCTCPAGRWIWCRHKQLLGLAKPAAGTLRPLSVKPIEAAKAAEKSGRRAKLAIVKNPQR